MGFSTLNESIQFLQISERVVLRQSCAKQNLFELCRLLGCKADLVLIDQQLEALYNEAVKAEEIFEQIEAMVGRYPYIAELFRSLHQDRLYLSLASIDSNFSDSLGSAKEFYLYLLQYLFGVSLISPGEQDPSYQLFSFSFTDKLTMGAVFRFSAINKYYVTLDSTQQSSRLSFFRKKTVGVSVSSLKKELLQIIFVQLKHLNIGYNETNIRSSLSLID